MPWELNNSQSIASVSNVGNTFPPVVLSVEQSCSIVPYCSIGKHAPPVVVRDVNS